MAESGMILTSNVEEGRCGRKTKTTASDDKMIITSKAPWKTNRELQVIQLFQG